MATRYMANASWQQQEEKRGGTRRAEEGQLWPLDHDCVVAEQQQQRREGDGGKGVGEVLALSLNVKAQALSSFWVDHSKAANGRLAGRSVGGRGWQP